MVMVFLKKLSKNDDKTLNVLANMHYNTGACHYNSFPIVKYS